MSQNFFGGIKLGGGCKEKSGKRCRSDRQRQRRVGRGGKRERGGSNSHPNCSPFSPFSKILLGALSLSAVRICLVFLGRGFASFLSCQAGFLNGRGL